MNFYYFVFLSIFAVALIGLNPRYEKKCLLIMAAIMTIMQGFRWNTGADWTQFYFVYEKITWSNFYRIYHGDVRTLEIGYSFLNILCKTIFKHYTFFLLFTCGFINFTFAKTIWNYVPLYKTMCLALTLAVSPLFPVRNALAGTLMLWAIPYIISKDWKRFLLVVMLCSSIHTMGTIGILFYWIDKQINAKYLWVAYFVSPFISSFSYIFNILISIPVIRDLTFLRLINRYNSSFDADKFNTGFNFPYFVFFALILYLAIQYRNDILLVKIKRMINQRKFINICLNLFVIMLVVRNISSQGNTVFEITRINYFTTIGFPVLFVLGVSHFLRKQNVDIVLIVLVIFLYTMFRVRGFQFDYYSNLYIPYYSVFQNSPVRDYWFGNIY